MQEKEQVTNDESDYSVELVLARTDDGKYSLCFEICVDDTKLQLIMPFCQFYHMLSHLRTSADGHWETARRAVITYEGRN